MARFDVIDMDYRPDEYVVQRDDGSCYKRFHDSSEARAYYNHLQQLDDQRRTVEQNDEIIANQKRLIEAQERNSRISNRSPIPPMPTVSRQILDPEYKEWLQFKKETDPAYKRWKLQKEAEEARAKAAREAAMREAERKREQERLERERLEAERKRKIEEEERRLAPIRAREEAERQKRLAEERRIREERERQSREEYERKEAVKTFFKWVFGIAIVGGIIAVIIVFGKWILGAIFAVCLISAVLSSS